MKVVTCISDTSDAGYRGALRATCATQELTLVTLLYRGEWVSHRIKEALLRLYVRRLPRNEVVLFTDGYDAMMVASEGEILERYRSIGAPLVLSAERDSEPCSALGTLFPDSGRQRKFPDSGGFIGEAGVISTILERYHKSPPRLAEAYECLFGNSASEAVKHAHAETDRTFLWSSRYLWTLAYLTNPDTMALDVDASIFLSVPARGRTPEVPGDITSVFEDTIGELLGESWALVDGRLVNALSGSMPSHLHFNGARSLCKAFAKSNERIARSRVMARV